MNPVSLTAFVRERVERLRRVNGNAVPAGLRVWVTRLPFRTAGMAPTPGVVLIDDRICRRILDLLSNPGTKPADRDAVLRRFDRLLLHEIGHTQDAEFTRLWPIKRLRYVMSYARYGPRGGYAAVKEAEADAWVERYREV